MTQILLELNYYGLQSIKFRFDRSVVCIYLIVLLRLEIDFPKLHNLNGFRILENLILGFKCYIFISKTQTSIPNNCLFSAQSLPDMLEL